ncbi:C40 family peptidase [Sphingobacterium sp. SGG-5]|uniref:C40 family peptidase n=1 Tax=Sphingobacterium sp. SGG-5 TaxID=2710881 RepID=UPI001F0EEAC8|nr:NlpC/P60 family protein [Sphingobacterium sp. SGG-5]
MWKKDNFNMYLSGLHLWRRYAMLLWSRIQTGLAILSVLFFLASCGVKKKTASYEKPNTKSSLTTYYADLLGVKPNDLNKDLYAFIDSWMGSPHRLGGMSRAGIDCSGFVNLAFREIYHKNLPRTSRDMAEVVKRKYDNQLREGDLVFFSFGGKGVDHVGIYLHNDRFVHVSTKQGVVISNLKDAWYYKYLSRCGTPEI